MLGFRAHWNTKGKNCFVTGGSQGLGLSLAVLLAKKGANVTIVARNVENLKKAIAELERNRQSSEQTFRYHSYSLSKSAESHAALEAECKILSQQSGGAITAPDAFFLCAGSSRPSFFIENTEEHLIQGMEQAYWVQAWSAHAAVKKLVQEQRPGKIVFVGSTVSLTSFIGYAPYAPGKHALKGLAESLRSECVLYNIDIQIFFAPTMDSPGLVEELKTKPQLTKTFEDSDVMLSCDKAATVMLKGIETGDHHITATFNSQALANGNRGAAPITNPLIGPILDCIAWIAVPFWRRGCDSEIRKNRNEHRNYLKTVGFLLDSKKVD
ncbi:oxidoreductase [Fomitiporia mediterranea MF3/22]|uniref:oxidoreductase n=1 Tax=Fomitiporia mediterranea (strain MF3/22) TaxID=694068 RepID=UPI0004409364|nr:oxidoreductase [Fomitiporia mediterranea MF3/22]EJC99774.1 oxidoreductase [Fomitiporia mediterranea MF3/22]